MEPLAETGESRSSLAGAIIGMIAHEAAGESSLRPEMASMRDIRRRSRSPAPGRVSHTVATAEQYS